MIERTDKPYTATNALDDILGFFNWIDRIQSWLTFVLRNRRTVEYRMRFNGDHSLNETIAHLGKYGVLAVRSGFDSRSMTYIISEKQRRWHDRLVTYRDGTPSLYKPRRAWKK